MKIKKIYHTSWANGTYLVRSGMTPNGWQFEAGFGNVQDYMDHVSRLTAAGYAMVNDPATN